MKKFSEATSFVIRNFLFDIRHSCVFHAYSLCCPASAADKNWRSISALWGAYPA